MPMSPSPQGKYFFLICAQVFAEIKMGIDAEQVIKLQQDQRYGDFMATFTPPFFVIKTKPDRSLQLTTPTRYGIECVKTFLSGGEMIVKELGELDPLYFEYYRSMNKDLIKALEGKNGEIKEEGGKIVVKGPPDLEDVVDKLQNAFQQLDAFDAAEEMPIKESQFKRAEEVLKQLGKNVSHTVVKYSDNEYRLIVLVKEYGQLKKVKTLLKSISDKTSAASDQKNRQRDVPDIKQPLSTTPKHIANAGQAEFTLTGVTIRVYEGNICRLDVDCIVNAANDRLSHRGGVAFAIAKAAGDELTEESDRLVREGGKIGVGRAVATTAGNLNYKCVIHCVGPAWYQYTGRTREDDCSRDLHAAVLNSLHLADDGGCTSIALPAISSGT